MAASIEFVRELVALCSKYNAHIFPRRDSRQLFISIEVGPDDAHMQWLDYKRIGPEGAEWPKALDVRS